VNIKKYFKIKYYREIFDLKNHLFRKEALLKINHIVGTSNKLIFLNKSKLNEIYEILNEHDQINKDSMWHSIFNKYHIEFLNFTKNNKNNLKYALDNPRLFNIFYGFDNNVKVFHDNPGFNFKFKYSVSIVDKLISLCESLEILRLDNPEYHNKKYKDLNIEKLISKIEKKIKLKLKFKNPFPGEKGIKTSRGIISEREIQAIYQAYKIKKIMNDNKFKTKNILEFGGGLGRTAYYCYQFGIKNYTLVDLLVPRICQINYLSRLINDKKIISKPKNIDFKNNNIKIISPEIFFSNNIKFDLVFNSDSFTEIDYQNQKKYKNYVLKNSKIFFSINHEYNHYKVGDFFKTKNLKEYTRNLYWLKRGYVEEKFKFK
jgi:hypothetical protein